MKLTRWSPARDLWKAHDEMGRLMDQFFDADWTGGSTLEAGDWLPGMDVAEDNDKFTVNLELPGLRKEDVNVTYRDGVLTIEGERRHEEEKKDVNYHRVERRYGKFRRSFSVPARIKDDKIDATFKDGVLHIELPKAEEVKPKAINVKVEG